MWSKNGMPVDADALPPPSTSSTRSIVVSLVVAVLLRRRSRGHRDVRPSPAGASSRSAARKASFSSGVPMVTRRQSVEAGPAEKSRTSTPWSTSCCHSAWPSPSAPEEHEVGARREHGDAVDVVELGGARRSRSRDQARARGRPSRRRTRARAVPAIWVARRQVVRQHDLVELARPPTAAPPRSRAAARPSTRPSSRCARPRAGDRRATSSSALHGRRTRRTPRRPRRGRSPSAASSASTVAARLDRAGRVVGAAHEHDRRARCSSMSAAAGVGIDREVGVAARRRPPRCR